MPTASRSRSCLAAALATVLLAGAAGGALAHPHVKVIAKAEIAYENGRVAGIRHAWTFDAEYTSYMTQGLDTNGDGKVSQDELAGLAKENTANLAEFAYFTKLKVAGKDQEFAEPSDPRMQMQGDKLTLTFLLPLKTPAAQGKGVAALEVYDPTYYVDFGFAEGADAVHLAAAPTGCAVSLTRPKPAAQTAEAGKPMTEAFFDALTSASNYGQQFANRALVACP